MSFKDWAVCIGATVLTLSVVGIVSLAFMGAYDGHLECMVIHCVKVLR